MRNGGREGGWSRLGLGGVYRVTKSASSAYFEFLCGNHKNAIKWVNTKEEELRSELASVNLIGQRLVEIFEWFRPKIAQTVILFLAKKTCVQLCTSKDIVAIFLIWSHNCSSLTVSPCLTLIQCTPSDTTAKREREIERERE